MPSTNSPSLSSNKNAPPESTHQPIKILSRRLEEADIDTYRFIKLQPGKKAPISHTLLPPDDADDCYGVYAGSGLVFLDIDDYRDGAEAPMLSVHSRKPSPSKAPTEENTATTR